MNLAALWLPQILYSTNNSGTTPSGAEVLPQYLHPVTTTSALYCTVSQNSFCPHNVFTLGQKISKTKPPHLPPRSYTTYLDLDSPSLHLRHHKAPFSHHNSLLSHHISPSSPVYVQYIHLASIYLLLAITSLYLDTMYLHLLKPPHLST